MTVPISNMTQVFTNSSITYNAIGMNVITGGQASDSTILNLKANGTLVYSVSLDGSLNIPSGNIKFIAGSQYIPIGNLVIGDESYWGPYA